MPSLEERREDIPLLIDHFLHQFNARNDRNVGIEPAAVKQFQRAAWPGNVRELENTVYRLAIFAHGDCIALADIEAESQRTVRKTAIEAGALPQPDRLLELERQHIVHMLKATQGNKSEAARRLGIERKTLYKKAVRLGINLQSMEDQ